MHLEKLEIVNFLSFGPAQTVDLAHLGLTLVEGVNLDDALARSNGAGKSAVAEALFWVLWGKTLRGLRGDAVIHERVGRDCLVRLQGHHDGQAFEVVRGRKLEGRHATLTLRIGGDDRTAGNDSAETQRRLEAYLGTTAEVFSHTVVCGQGAAWRFTALGDTERKALLDRLLGVERIAKAHGWVRERHQGFAAQAQEAEQAVAAARAQRQADKELWRQLRAARRGFVAKQRVQLSEQLERIDARVAALTEELARAPRIDVGDSQPMQADLERAVDEAARTSAALGVAEAARQTAAVQLERLRQVRAGEPCQACNNVMDEVQIGKQLAVAKRALRAAEATVQEAQKEARLAAGRKRDLHLAARQDRELAQQAMQETARRRAEEKRLQELQIEREVVEAELQALTAPKPSKREREAKRAFKGSKAELKLLEAQLAEAQRQAAHFGWWLHGFGAGGVKSHLIDHVAPVLSRHAQTFAQQLSPALQVRFDAQTALKSGEQRDRLAVQVQYTHGAADYTGASTGEKRKVDVVIALALRALVQGERRCNVTIWDEVTDGLDEASAEAVMGLLRDQARDGTTLVISHAEWLKPHFPHVLTVTKQNGFSTLSRA